jgi:hypothetical protein
MRTCAVSPLEALDPTDAVFTDRFGVLGYDGTC